MEKAEVTNTCETCAHSCMNCWSRVSKELCPPDKCPHHICFQCAACECWEPLPGVEESDESK